MRGFSLEDRFWAKVTKAEGDECWDWTAFRNPRGYGMIGMGRGVRLAHRVSWTLHFGEIPAGMCVMHNCDNPPCTKPEHLKLGTRAENNEDRHAKGRSGGAPGEDNAWSRLTDADALRIMELREQGLTYAAIAAEIGEITRATVYKVVKGRSWSHVTGVEKFVP
jgi:hypothetical protein